MCLWPAQRRLHHSWIHSECQGHASCFLSLCNHGCRPFCRLLLCIGGETRSWIIHSTNDITGKFTRSADEGPNFIELLKQKRLLNNLKSSRNRQGTSHKICDKKFWLVILLGLKKNCWIALSWASFFPYFLLPNFDFMNILCLQNGRFDTNICFRPTTCCWQ